MPHGQKPKSQLSDGDQLILATVEVPQASDLFKVFEVAKLVANGAGTPAKVAVGLRLKDREGAYYLSAARALRLVRKLPQGEPADYALSYLGESYLKAKGDKARAAVMVTSTLGAPHVVYVAERLGLPTPLSTPTPRELHDVARVERELISLGPLNGDTPRRRASTVASWMKTVDKLARSIR
jgi:hypothetical protein